MLDNKNRNLFEVKFVSLFHARWDWELVQRGKEVGQESKLQRTNVLTNKKKEQEDINLKDC